MRTKITCTALLRIDELYNYGDFRGGYFLCLSYNSIKTFLMVQSIFLTTLVAYDRWRLSRFKVQIHLIYPSINLYLAPYDLYIT